MACQVVSSNVETELVMISDLQKPPSRTAAKPKSNSISVSPILTELAHVEPTDVFAKLKTSPEGLSRAAAEARMLEYGPNAVAMEKRRGWLWRLSGEGKDLFVHVLALRSI